MTQMKIRNGRKRTLKRPKGSKKRGKGSEKKRLRMICKINRRRSKN